MSPINGGGQIPAVPRTTRDRWIEAGLEALARGGPDAVRVETLAAQLGVTKGGFYGYFDGRPALLTEMLDEWERRCTTAVLAQAEAEGGDAADRIRRAGRLTFTEDLHRIDLAVRAWARHDESVATRLRRIDNERMTFLRKMFGAFITDPDEVEARSTLTFALAIGRHFIVADHPGYTTREAVELAGEYLLRPPR
ncbi:TetR/AcrR family transcriptional regulator [Nocardia implantans]|uniref:TetR/AcrR family transcriptional regulator n=1 Tax=Nocardia implantans TaxID=3108168 RepID=A0ABU6ATD3_9NOCA|nr:MULTISPECIES: TetR/AcrR family transcriptional regulator [unclassified Nocardia]MBF6191868.1 TetR/AcrR family transcriptional regulator [Nocardia beijingensis]MEA3527820.1 TetR/AcrR family transcriptional regulator [Nocardia sp. CDC192]MEB3510429.1 TetR/AcrR family transcriptional regulator [Nocardia sp. CDC186]